MAEAHIVSTLERYCIDLDKRLEEYRRLKTQAESDLVHLRSAMEFVERSDGNPNAKIPTVSVARVFKRGEIFALCADALAQNGPELSTRDLAEVCIKAGNLDSTNGAQRRAMMQLLIEVLTLRRQNGEIVKSGSHGRVSLWRLPAQAAK